MVISRSPAASKAITGRLLFGSASLPLRYHIKILRVTADQDLSYDRHVSSPANQTSQRVSALRRMANALGPRGVFTLYKAQIRPYMECGALLWMSSADTHMRRLYTVQRHVLQLVENSTALHLSANVTSLEHRSQEGDKKCHSQGRGRGCATIKLTAASANLHCQELPSVVHINASHT